MTAPSFVGANATTTRSSGLSRSVALPAGTSVGDLMLLAGSTSSTQSLSAPAGWTEAVTQVSAGVRAGVWYKVATSLDVSAGPGTVALTAGSSSAIISVAVAVYSTAGSTPNVVASYASSPTSSGTLTSPTVTTTAADTRVVHIFAADTTSDDKNLAAQAPLTNRVTGDGVGVGDETYASAGTTTSRSATCSGSTSSTVWAAFTVALAPGAPTIPLTYEEEALADGPAALYMHGSASGTTATDSSGNDNHGTYVGGVTLADTTDHALGDLPHIRLDGSTGYMQLPAVAAPPSGWLHPDAAGMTVEAWAYIRTNQSWARLVDFSHAANSERLYIVPKTSNPGQAGVHSFGSFQGFNELGTGSWQLVTLTMNASGVVRFYVNGGQVWSATLGNPFDLALPYLYIGKSAYSADPTLAASIGPVAVYNTELSASRVAAHASAMLEQPGVSGTIAATLPALSANLSGGIEFSGTITATLPPLGANLAGTSAPAGITGSLSATLPPLGASLAGAYSDTATLAAILPPLSADLTGTYAPPPVSGTLAASLPSLSANLTGQAFEPGVGGFLAGVLPALSASLSGQVLGRNGLGLVLDSSAVLTVDDVLEPEPTVPTGTPPTVLHIIAPTVPVPTLVAGRPQ